MGRIPLHRSCPVKKVVKICLTEAGVIKNDNTWALEGIHVSIKSLAGVIMDDGLALDFLLV